MSSEAGAVYRIVASADLTKWEPVAEEIPSGGATTAHTLGNAPDGTRYYRVERTR